MTSEEKRDRRKARHELQKAFRDLLRRPSKSGMSAGFVYTKPQMKQATKVLADRFYAEQIRPTSERIEKKLVAEQTHA